MVAPSGTVTFLFTDIEGSTRLWQRDESAMRAALSRHDELLRSAIAEYGGTVFSAMGDGVAAAFLSASSAVRAALAAQRFLEAETWPTATSLRVRMGLHTGEAEERDGDYFGTAVNRAARLMAVGHGGQVLCSQVTAALVDSDLALVDLGEHRLQDLDRPMHVFQVGGGSFAPLRSLDVLPGNLPSLASSFVGREMELAAVAKDLGGARLVTLTGVGGVGKTRLALQVAAELLPGFADGAWVCELAAAASGEELAQVVASVFGVAQRAHMSMAESVIDFLRGRQMLVVLDNCEHLLDDAARLAEMILADAPGVRVLATSREGFGIPGEYVRPVRSLGLPADAAGALSSDAVVLFGERARAVDPDFVLDAQSVGAVAEICRRLDGIPLAIELAAARVGVMSPAEISGHLDERFRLLTGGRRGRVERHQTLRAAVEWSYSLLADSERVVFGRLGVFPASFDEAAAVAVCTGDSLERWDVLDALASLVAKSMVGAERTGDATRYQLLETLRLFARDGVGSAGELDGLRRRHAAHYAGFAERVGAGVMSRDELLWRPRVAIEMDNLRSGVNWAFEATDPADVSLGVRILDGLLFEATVQNSWGIQGWAGAVLPRAEQLDTAEQSVVFAAAALNSYWVGEFDQAIAFGERAIADSGLFNPALGTAFMAVSLSHLALGDPSAAMALFDGADRRLPPDGATAGWWVCVLHILRVAAAHFGGDLDTARSEAALALESARPLGSPTLLAMTLMYLALTEEEPGEALAAAEESIRLIEAGAANSIYSTVLMTAAALRSAEGDTASAARHLGNGLEHEARVGSSRPMVAALIALTASVLADQADGLELAAILSGAVSGPVLGPIGIFTLGVHRQGYDASVAQIAQSLDPSVYTTATRRGAAMTYDEIIDFTLDQLAPLTTSRSQPDQ